MPSQNQWLNQSSSFDQDSWENDRYWHQNKHIIITGLKIFFCTLQSHCWHHYCSVRGLYSLTRMARCAHVDSWWKTTQNAQIHSQRAGQHSTDRCCPYHTPPCFVLKVRGTTRGMTSHSYFLHPVLFLADPYIGGGTLRLRQDRGTEENGAKLLQQETLLGTTTAPRWIIDMKNRRGTHSAPFKWYREICNRTKGTCTLELCGSLLDN